MIIHKTHDTREDADGGEVCRVCKLRNDDLAAKCGDTAEVEMLRERRDTAFQADLDSASVRYAMNAYDYKGKLMPRLVPELRKMMAERFLKVTGEHLCEPTEEPDK